MAHDPRWTDVDQYFIERLHAEDPVLNAAQSASEDAGLRPIAVNETLGKFLMLQVKALRATRILEIGTMAAYSTLWMARGLASGGQIVTLERDPQTAFIARRNVQRAGAESIIDVVVGDAEASLADMVQRGADPFDLIFIDADRPNIPLYMVRALSLSHPGTVIVIDNVVRNGAIVGGDPTDEIRGIKQWADMIGLDPSVECTVIQTVSSKGYDGFAYCVVN